MKEYYVTVTYLATVNAEDEQEAQDIVQAWIDNGDLLPNDIEIEENNMTYAIELNKDELKALNKFLKEKYKSVKALRNNEAFRVEYEEGDSLENREQELLLLIGKLDNVIMAADKITRDDVSILGKRKYKLFRRK